MKYIVAILLSVTIASAQYTDFMTTKVSDSTAISLKRMENRTWAFGTIDTTAPQNIKTYQTIVSAIVSTDTGAVTVSYQLSLDGTNWTAAVLYDSLRNTAGGVASDNTNLSTIALGYSYIRLIYSFNKSNIYGSTTYTSTLRKYWATLKVSR